jgi:uncharacterized protein (DUF2141 family)
VAGLLAIVWTGFLKAETLHITVTNVPQSQGTIMLQILSDEAEFNGDGSAIVSLMQRAQSGEMHCAATLPDGEYAFRVMHDLNDNGELDSNFVGMPTEPWAFSNNAVGKFGPPQWSDVRFELRDDLTQTIDLNF